MHPSVEQAIGRDRIRKAFKRYENNPADEHDRGIVRAVNPDGSYEVLLDGDVQTARCAPYAKAMVGDRVIVVTTKDGENVLLGRLGGETETILPGIHERFEKLEVDYIVAEGTSGIWTYRKWSSGVAECWASPWIDAGDITQTWGGWYFHTAKSIDSYPFTFKSAPSILAFKDNGAEGLLIAAGSGTTASPPSVYLVRPNSYSGAEYRAHILAIGRWK